MTYFLGIDGGGSKTRCVLGTETAVLGTGSGAGCNVLRVGEACALDSLSSAIHEACVQSGVSPREVSRTCAGIAGAADDGVASSVQRLLLDVVGGAIEVIGDMEIALESAFGEEAGIIAIAGTGSIVFGRNSLGETARAGGWGRAISDEGSGHWCVVRALNAALHAHDRGEACGLLRLLMAGLEARTIHELAVTVNADPLPDLASVFPVVLTASDRGDRIATEVLVEAGRELANLAGLVIDRLFEGSAQVPIAKHGGVLSSSAQVRASFESALKSKYAAAKFVQADIDPVIGALSRARRDFVTYSRKSSAR